VRKYYAAVLAVLVVAAILVVFVVIPGANEPLAKPIVKRAGAARVVNLRGHEPSAELLAGVCENGIQDIAPYLVGDSGNVSSPSRIIIVCKS
jgi:hypothetical protein